MKRTLEFRVIQNDCMFNMSYTSASIIIAFSTVVVVAVVVFVFVVFVDRGKRIISLLSDLHKDLQQESCIWLLRRLSFSTSSSSYR